MKRKTMLTIAYTMVLVLAVSGQDAGQTNAKLNELNAYLLEGNRLLDANKPEEALKAFQKAAQLSPQYIRVMVGQYRSLMQLKRVNEANKILDNFLASLVAANPADPKGWDFRAMVEAQMNRPEEALKSFTKLTELEPNDGGHWIGRGQMLAELGRYDEALKAFDKAITLDPKHSAAWNNRGGILLDFEKYDDAIESFNKAIELAPKWDSSYYGRACVYARKGDKTRALADLKTAMQLQREPWIKAAAAKEDHFSSLRDDPDFKKLLESEPAPLALIPSKPKILSARDMDRLMGQWVGKLDVPGDVVYTVILRFEKTKDGKFISVTDCPEYGSSGNALTEVFVDGDQLTWKLPLTNGSYIGRIEGNTITGTYTVGGTDYALHVTKGAAKPKPIVTQMKISPDAMKNLLGRWKGTLGVMEVIFRFERNAGKDAVFVDIPVQNAKGIPAITASLIDDALSLRIAGAEYNGKLNGNKIEGVFKPIRQGDIPLTLTKE